MRPFERIRVWQPGLALVAEVYSVSRRWPVEERFGLTAQVRRAAVSVVANIAEGSAKRGPKEFRRYLDISLGSLEEVACLLLARSLKIMDQRAWDELEALRDHAGKSLWGLFRAVSKQAKDR